MNRSEQSVRPNNSKAVLLTQEMPSRSRLSRSLPFLALALVPFFLQCLIQSVSDLRSYPAIDLRSKVVGARLLAAGHDPYVSYEDPQHSEYFKSTTRPNYTPVLLALYVPLSSLQWWTQRAIYFALDWLFAAAALCLLLRYFCDTREKKYVCWIVYAVFIFCSYAFRIHLERGQYYVFLLLLTCQVAVALKKGWSGWLACVPAALLLLVRPTYGLILPVAFLCFGARRWTLRVVVVAATIFALTLPLGGIQRWAGFMHNVRSAQQLHLNEIMNGCSVATKAAPPTSVEPSLIENIDFSRALEHRAINGTFIGIVGWVLGHSDVLVFLRRYCSTHWITLANSAGTAVVLLCGVGIIWISRKRSVSPTFLIAFLALWPTAFEIFGPERFLYTSVVEVLPLVLVLLDWGRFQRGSGGWVKYFVLPALLALGLLPPIAFQLGQKHGIIATPMSAATLVILPLSLFAYTGYAIWASPRRNTKMT